jgi:hypothetical protein
VRERQHKALAAKRKGQEEEEAKRQVEAAAARAKVVSLRSLRGGGPQAWHRRGLSTAGRRAERAALQRKGCQRSRRGGSRTRPPAACPPSPLPCVHTAADPCLPAAAPGQRRLCAGAARAAAARGVPAAGRGGAAAGAAGARGRAACRGGTGAGRWATREGQGALLCHQHRLAPRVRASAGQPLPAACERTAHRRHCRPRSAPPCAALQAYPLLLQLDWMVSQKEEPGARTACRAHTACRSPHCLHPILPVSQHAWRCPAPLSRPLVARRQARSALLPPVHSGSPAHSVSRAASLPSPAGRPAGASALLFRLPPAPPGEPPVIRGTADQFQGLLEATLAAELRQQVGLRKERAAVPPPLRPRGWARAGCRHAPAPPACPLPSRPPAAAPGPTCREGAWWPHWQTARQPKRRSARGRLWKRGTPPRPGSAHRSTRRPTRQRRRRRRSFG